MDLGAAHHQKKGKKRGEKEQEAAAGGVVAHLSLRKKAGSDQRIRKTKGKMRRE